MMRTIQKSFGLMCDDIVELSTKKDDLKRTGAYDGKC